MITFVVEGSEGRRSLRQYPAFHAARYPHHRHTFVSLEAAAQFFPEGAQLYGISQGKDSEGHNTFGSYMIKSDTWSVQALVGGRVQELSPDVSLWADLRIDTSPILSAIFQYKIELEVGIDNIDDPVLLQDLAESKVAVMRHSLADAWRRGRLLGVPEINDAKVLIAPDGRLVSARGMVASLSIQDRKLTAKHRGINWAVDAGDAGFELLSDWRILPGAAMSPSENISGGDLALARRLGTEHGREEGTRSFAPRSERALASSFDIALAHDKRLDAAARRLRDTLGRDATPSEQKAYLRLFSEAYRNTMEQLAIQEPARQAKRGV